MYIQPFVWRVLWAILTTCCFCGCKKSADPPVVPQFTAGMSQEDVLAAQEAYVAALAKERLPVRGWQTLAPQHPAVDNVRYVFLDPAAMAEAVSLSPGLRLEGGGSRSLVVGNINGTDRDAIECVMASVGVTTRGGFHMPPDDQIRDLVAFTASMVSALAATDQSNSARAPIPDDARDHFQQELAKWKRYRLVKRVPAEPFQSLMPLRPSLMIGTQDVDRVEIRGVTVSPDRPILASRLVPSAGR